MKPFILIFIFAVITACSTEQNNGCESDECLKQRAYDAVIASHDEVMPKLSHLSSLKEQIEQRIDGTTDSLLIMKWHDQMLNLEAADEAMWVWMRQFNSDLEDVEIEKALGYLKEEQLKIDSVASKINETIRDVEKILK